MLENALGYVIVVTALLVFTWLLLQMVLTVVMCCLCRPPNFRLWFAKMRSMYLNLVKFLAFMLFCVYYYFATRESLNAIRSLPNARAFSQ